MADTKTAAEWRQTAANLQQKLDALNQSFAPISGDLQQVSSLIATSQNTVLAAQAQLARLEAQGAPASQIQAARNSLATAINQTETLKAKQSQLNSLNSQYQQRVSELNAEIANANGQAARAEQAPPNTQINTAPANPDPGPNTAVTPNAPAIPPTEPENINTTTEELTVPPGTDTEEEGRQPGLEEPEDIDDSLGLPPGADPDEGPQEGLEEPPLINEPLTTPDGEEETGERAQTGLREPTSDDVNAGTNEARSSGGKNPTQVVETSAIKKAPDWRFRIQLAPGANYLYKAPGNAGILTPLKGTDGVIFPYAPIINISYNANYETSEVPHSNFKIYNYRNSAVESISITGDFTAQDTNEANYVLAVIHFFRSVTKMFYGKDQDPARGVPPPLCYLTGYGDYAFDRHPVVITNFTLNYPNDVDYINATTDDDGNSSTGGNQQLPIYSAPTIGTPTRLQRLLGAKLAPGGVRPVQPPSSFSQSAVTRVPTKISITLNALPVVTRYNYSNRFSLKDYATGKLLAATNKAGGIW